MKSAKEFSFSPNVKLFIIVVLAFVILFVPTTISSTLAVDVAPAPPSIGAAVPLTYFGPSPSMVKPELIGPYQLLKAGKVDLDAGTIALPLCQQTAICECEYADAYNHSYSYVAI